jgi:8-oxo-dGTP pyrophosphatase MutT (NUDIX family)
MFIKNQLTENVKLLQKAVIIRKGEFGKEVLILKRSVDSISRPNCWDLPGGNSEWPEANQSSAANLHLIDLKREVFEETSLIIKLDDLTLANLVHFSTYFDSEKQIFTVIGGWLIDYLNTDQKEIRISSEHQEYIWVSEADLSNYDFGGVKGAFVLDIIKQAFAKF